MHNLNSLNEIKQALELDTYAWFSHQLHGHMGKWQYMEPEYKGDPVQGSALWDAWEQEASQTDNMLMRQSEIIKEQLNDITDCVGTVNNIIDLGPGGVTAVEKNTLPFIQIYKHDLKTYTAIDMAEESVANATSIAKKMIPQIDIEAIHEDFYNSTSKFKTGKTLALIMGGTIGNFEARPNTNKALSLMATKILQLKNSLPTNTTLLIGLEATQSAHLLYRDYDHLSHAQYEINLMHAIKRDLLTKEEGFDPYAWKYTMKWCPQSYQFCHIAEATELQIFELSGKYFRFPKGTQLVVDNSFKFPVLAMQRAAQLAKVKYLKPFSDDDGRMVIHAIQL